MATQQCAQNSFSHHLNSIKPESWLDANHSIKQMQRNVGYISMLFITSGFDACCDVSTQHHSAHVLLHWREVAGLAAASLSGIWVHSLAHSILRYLCWIGVWGHIVYRLIGWLQPRQKAISGCNWATTVADLDMRYAYNRYVAQHLRQCKTRNQQTPFWLKSMTSSYSSNILSC